MLDYEESQGLRVTTFSTSREDIFFKCQNRNKSFLLKCDVLILQNVYYYTYLTAHARSEVGYKLHFDDIRE